MPDEPLQQTIRYVNSGGTNPAFWRNLSADELTALLLNASAKVSPSVVQAIEARFAAVRAAEGQRTAVRQPTNRLTSTIVLLMVLAVLVALVLLFAR